MKLFFDKIRSYLCHVNINGIIIHLNFFSHQVFIKAINSSLLDLVFSSQLFKLCISIGVIRKKKLWKDFMTECCSYNEHEILSCCYSFIIYIYLCFLIICIFFA